MHRPLPEPPSRWWTAWQVEPALVVALGVATLAYLRGWRRLRARRPARVAPWRVAAFMAGVATLFVALASPLDTLADRFLAVHMAQHLVLLVVTPSLLLLGEPLLPLLHALPAGRARSGLGRLAIRLSARLTHPLIGFAAMSLVMWGWHVPAAFELALRSPAWHVAEHVSFLAAGLLFWWPVILPWPARARWPAWAMIPYLLLADLQNTVIAALLTFSDRILYSSYASGSDPLGDQVAAGVLMWVPMSLAYLIPAAVLAARLLAPRLARPAPCTPGASASPARL